MKPTLPKFLSESVLESKRFGLTIARGTISRAAPPDAALIDIIALKPEVAIFRCEAGDLSQLPALRARGLHALHADTLVYYSVPLGQRRSSPIEPPHQIRLGEPGDGDDLAAIVRQSFSEYRNHYHANPLFSPAAILEGYVEWALNYVAQPNNAKQTWVYCVEGRPVSFATCHLSSGGLVEIILNATAPAWAGHGFYSRLLGHLINHYGAAGSSKLEISTQIWNYGVQRVWTRAELMIDRAYDTYHVNVPASISGALK